MSQLLDTLSGGDLRSIGKSNAVAHQVRSQQQFDKLFEGLFHNDRLIVMRTADAIEKITREQYAYLHPHKKTLLRLLATAKEKELKWHLASLVSRLKLTKTELGKVWTILTQWALDADESRIVRVNSVQGLFELSKQSPSLKNDYELTLTQLEKEEVPSIRARIRHIRKVFH